MKYNPLSRRMFLQGTGGALLSIPFLGSLLPREARAQAATVPKRFISILSDYDIGHNSVWLPGSTGNITNIPQPNRILAGTNGHHDIRWQPLREFAPTNSSVLASLYGTSLSPYLESMNILRSLDFPDRRAHDVSRALGAVASDNVDLGKLALIPSIDHILNNNATFNPAGLPLIYAGATSNTSWSHSVQGTSAAKATLVGTSLLSMYNALFSNGNLPENGQSVTAHPKYDVLTRVLDDYTRVKNSRNISANDKLALENAMDKISDVQKSLNKVSTAMCSHKSLSKSGQIYEAANSAVIGKALADLITAAVICDTSRVFTIGADMINIFELYDGESFDHQITSHQPFLVTNGKPQWQRIAERQAGVARNFISPLVQNLSTAIDPSNGKSYLYNSLLFYSMEGGLVHGWASSPVITFGNAGGTISSGNYIDYADRTKGATAGADIFNDTPGNAQFSSNWWGVSYNRVLNTVLQGMGLAPADYEKNALNSQLYGRSDIGAANVNLNNIGGYGYAVGTDISVNSWAVSAVAKPSLAKYDLKQFKYKLPMP